GAKLRDEHMLQPRKLRADLQDLRQQRGGYDDGDGSSVLEDVPQIVRGQQGISRYRDRADLDRAEERIDERGRIHDLHDDPLLHLDAEVLERVARSVDVRGELA